MKNSVIIYSIAQVCRIIKVYTDCTWNMFMIHCFTEQRRHDLSELKKCRLMSSTEEIFATIPTPREL